MGKHSHGKLGLVVGLVLAALIVPSIISQVLYGDFLEIWVMLWAALLGPS